MIIRIHSREIYQPTSVMKWYRHRAISMAHMSGGMMWLLTPWSPCIKIAKGDLMKTKSFTKIDTILLVTSNYISLVVAFPLSNQNRFDYRILHGFSNMKSVLMKSTRPAEGPGTDVAIFPQVIAGSSLHVDSPFLDWQWLIGFGPWNPFIVTYCHQHVWLSFGFCWTLVEHPNWCSGQHFCWESAASGCLPGWYWLMASPKIFKLGWKAWLSISFDPRIIKESSKLSAIPPKTLTLWSLSEFQNLWTIQGGAPPVISWFINPVNYSYICHKP